MRFYDVPVNQSVPTEANRDLTSYKFCYTGKWVGVGSGLGSDVIQPNPNPTPTQVFDASMGLG
jgi:hypothetical protein